MFLPQEIIRKKRDRQALSSDDIRAFIAGITSDLVSESQITAFTMAVFLNGMEAREAVDLTLAMRDSGRTMDWSSLNLDGPVIDKHSTGGVGDTVSLMLGPLWAAVGAYNPMISGRGLGHTGGTLDKLGSIPGYNPFPSPDLLKKTVRQAGTAIIGQTSDLAPADKRMYAARDISATVESIPLITASILSKKLSAGLQTLVMDVKVGNGAFMPTPEASRDLAESIVRVGTGAGLQVRALLTDMNQSLAPWAGNNLEVLGAIDYLTGKDRPDRLHRVTMDLAIEGLLASGMEKDRAAAERRLLQALESGKAAERFATMVSLLGGPSDILEHPRDHLHPAPVVLSLTAPRSGTIQNWDTRTLGLAIVALGGGRLTSDAVIDPRVGLDNIVPLGSRVQAGQEVLRIHARTESDAQEARAMVLKALDIGDQATVPPLIWGKVDV